VRTILNSAERQNYPISDMIFSAQELVSKISHDMTLLPGDLIACGTSVGIGVMKGPVNTCFDEQPKGPARGHPRMPRASKNEVNLPQGREHPATRTP